MKHSQDNALILKNARPRDVHLRWVGDQDIILGHRPCCNVLVEVPVLMNKVCETKGGIVLADGALAEVGVVDDQLGLALAEEVCQPAASTDQHIQEPLGQLKKCTCTAE